MKIPMGELVLAMQISLVEEKEGFRYLKQNGLSLAGDIVTQVACMTKPEEEYFNWHIVWFPIEK